MIQKRNDCPRTHIKEKKKKETRMPYRMINFAQELGRAGQTNEKAENQHCSSNNIRFRIDFMRFMLSIVGQ